MTGLFTKIAIKKQVPIPLSKYYGLKIWKAVKPQVMPKHMKIPSFTPTKYA